MSRIPGTPILPFQWRIEAWRLAFYMYFFLVNLGFGMYLTISRDAVQALLGYEYSFMSLVVAAENIPMVFAVIGGGLGDYLGRRTMVLLGFFSSIPLLLMGLLPISYLPLLAAGYVFFWGISMPSITGALLHATRSSGIQYSIYAVFGTIGWGLGGPFSGLLIRIGGWSLAYYVAALTVLLGYVVAYVFFPSHVVGGGAGFREIVSASRRVIFFFASSVLATAGFLLFFGNYALILRSRIGDPGLFGIVYTFIPALLGIMVRPFIGVLTERTEPSRIALTGILLYMAVITGLTYSTGLPMIILWALPVYPFLDQGFMLTFSRRLPGKLQAFASGIWSTALSLGGVIVLAISFTGVTGEFMYIYLCSLALLAASLIVLFMRIRRL